MKCTLFVLFVVVLLKCYCSIIVVLFYYYFVIILLLLCYYFVIILLLFCYYFVLSVSIEDTIESAVPRDAQVTLALA